MELTSLRKLNWDREILLQPRGSCASLVVQMVKNLPAMWETWVPSLGWEDPLQKGKATHSSILACIVHGFSKSQTQMSDFHFHFLDTVSLFLLSL